MAIGFTVKEMKWNDKFGVYDKVAKVLGIDKDLISKVEKKGDKYIVTYVTTPRAYDWHASITFFENLDYYGGKVEFLNVDKTKEYYELSKEAFENLKKELKEWVINNFDKLKDKIAKRYVDYPVSVELIDNNKVEIKYHPVSNYYGDGFRSGDNWRSSVDNDNVKTIIEKIPLFTESFKDKIEELFYKHAKKVGETKKVEIDVKEID